MIGGSGVYQIDGLEDAEWVGIDSPFWQTLRRDPNPGRLGGVAKAFLQRHGRAHVHSPSAFPYRANIDALKRLGVTGRDSVSACGSFPEEMAPGDFVIVDQFIDRNLSRGRGRSSAPASWPMARSPIHLSPAGDGLRPPRPREAGVTVHGGRHLSGEEAAVLGAWPSRGSTARSGLRRGSA